MYAQSINIMHADRRTISVRGEDWLPLIAFHIGMPSTGIGPVLSVDAPLNSAIVVYQSTAEVR